MNITSNPTDSYRVYVEHRPDYLNVYMGSDVFDYENAKNFWEELMPVIVQRRYDCVLIERDILDGPTSAEIFSVTCELANLRLTNTRFAIVDPNCGNENLHFEETVAQNRGVNIRILRNRRQAEQWLLVDQPADSVALPA